MFGMNRPHHIVDQNDDDSDDDDVDVYVSPRKFVGRTPGPKATKQRIFDEDYDSDDDDDETDVDTFRDPDTAGSYSPYPKKSNEGNNKNISLGIENVHYVIKDGTSKKQNDLPHKTVRRNTILSTILKSVNYIFVVLSIYLIVLSMWAFSKHRDGGLTAYLSIDGIALRSPIALATCLLITGIVGSFNAIHFGARQVAPSIVEGLHADSHRKAFAYHQILSTVTLLLLSILLLSTIPSLHHISQTGVSSTTWRKMTITHPEKICSFEIQNKCAGSMDMLCSADVESTISCPGLFCSLSCNNPSVSKPVLQTVMCRSCDHFESSALLKRCKASEENRNSSRSCRGPLRRVVKRFLLFFVISTAIAMSWMIVVVLMSMLSPILSA